MAAIALSQSSALQSDEAYHYAQIHLFLRGEFRTLHQYLTTIPGYHVAVALLLKTAAVDSLAAARMVNAMFGLLAVAGFFQLRRLAWPGTQTLATAQLLVLPILAPLFFLVYTDVLALALLLWALVATLRGHHGWSALALLALIPVRQNEVVWAGYAAALAAWPLLRERPAGWFIACLRSYWPSAIPVAAFCAFWAWNGTISLSPEQAQLHPLTFRVGNPCFALLAVGVLLPLHTLAGARDFAARLRSQPWLLALPLAVAAAFWWGFQADNPYNLVMPDVYPRNALLARLVHDPLWRAGASLIAALAAASLAATQLRPQGAATLFGFALIALGAAWLIDQRYTMVVLVLWLAVRQSRGRVLEWMTFALWLVCAVYVTSAILHGRASP